MLRRQGRAVTVFERFDAPRPVGAGFLLQPTGLAVLDALGLGEGVRALGQPVTRLFGRAVEDGRVVLDVRYAALGAGPALGVHRAAAFQLLHDACLREGVAFETGFEVAAASAGRLTAADGRTAGPFDLVVDAAGARSPIAAALGARSRPLAFGALWATTPWPRGAGFDAAALEQRYRRAERMVGMLPVGAMPGRDEPLNTFFWSLEAAALPAWRAAGLEAWKAEVLALWPQVESTLATIDHPEQLAFARYGHHTLARPAAERLAVIGDAAHATSPQLGQGVNMGLLDAWALARSLERADDLAGALAAYVRARRWHVRLYQALSLGFTPFYQGHGRALPWVRDHLLGRLSRLPLAPPLLAATVSGLLLDPRRRLGLPR